MPATSSHNLILVLNNQCQIISVSKNIEAELGYADTDLQQTPIWDLLPDSKQNFIEASFLSALENQGQLYFYSLVLHKNGELRQSEWSCSLLAASSDSSQIICSICFTDSTQQNVNEFFRELVETTSDWIWEVNQEGLYTYASPKVREILGYEPEEVIGKSPFDFMEPVEAKRVRKLFNNIAADGKIIDRLENVNIHKNGHAVILQTSGVPIIDDAGELKGYRGIDRDISSQKDIEKKQQETEQYLYQLAENINEVFYIFDLEKNKMLYVSPAYEKIWGQSIADLYHDPSSFLDKVHPDDKEHFRMIFEQPTCYGTFSKEFRIIHSDGEIRCIKSRTIPASIHEGQAQRIVGIAEDITDWKLEEQQRIETAKAQKDTLIREVHHRIKNNLQGIVGLLHMDILQQYPSLSTPLKKVINQISSIALVHGLHGQHNSSALLLCDLLSAIVTSVKTSYGPQANFRVTKNIDNPVQLGEEEAVPIALVINELLNNAYKHLLNPELNQPIDIQLDICNGIATLSINSNSKPLPAEFNFEKGKQLGTGLELVKSLLPHHGASLSFSQYKLVNATLILMPPVVYLSKLSGDECPTIS